MKIKVMGKELSSIDEAFQDKELGDYYRFALEVFDNDDIDLNTEIGFIELSLSVDPSMEVLEGDYIKCLVGLYRVFN